ncbi:MAG: HAMP domain-containing sensor histidine kinase [Vicinamibacterales bacterium]
MTRLGLLARVYLFGIGLLALLLVLVVALFDRQVVPAIRAATRLSLTWAGEDLLADCEEPRRLAGRLARARNLTPYEITVVCDGVVSYGSDAPLSPEALTSLQLEGHAALDEVLSLVVGTPARHVVFRDRSPLTFGVGPGSLALLLGGLAVAAWPVARSLSRPLEDLERQVVRFGDGDLTARVRSARRDEIGVVARAFDRMADSLESQVRAQKLLVAGFSHELRTPLQRMTSALALLPSTGTPDDEIRTEVMKDVGELTGLLDDTILLARIESGAATLDGLLRLAPCTVGALVDDATSGLSWMDPPPPVQVIVLDEVARVELDVDPRLAPRALKNLVDNAVTHGGGAPIRVDAAVEDGDVVLTVSDEGPGLDSTALDAVFTPFVRLDTERHGVGLGLALSRAIAVAHGGSLRAERPPDGGRGARFVLTLPARRGTRHPAGVPDADRAAR